MRWLMVLAAMAATLSAQTATPNAAGVSAGHLHFNSQDADGVLDKFADVLVGEKVSAGFLNMVKLPNIFIIVSPMEPTGGTNGSTVHHAGFMVKSFAETKARADAAGIPVQELVEGVQAFLDFGDGISVEVQEAEGVTVDAEFHHFHMQSANAPDHLAWYMDHFGGAPGTRRNQPVALIPGGEVDFLAAGMGGGKGGDAPALAPTQGRALDHIGFEVDDLEAFIAKLKANGVTMDADLRDLTDNIGLKIAFLTDPNGTYIELTEGLDEF